MIVEDLIDLYMAYQSAKAPHRSANLKDLTDLRPISLTNAGDHSAGIQTHNFPAHEKSMSQSLGDKRCASE